MEDIVISIIGSVGIIGIIASTAIGCYLCHKRKAHHPYKKAPAHSIDFTMAECDVEDSLNHHGRASIAMPSAPAGYGKVTLLEVDGEDESEDDDVVEEEEADADCAALNV